MLHAQELESAAPIRIAFVADATDPFAADLRALVRGELVALVRDEFDLRFPEELVFTVDGTNAGSTQALERLLADDQVSVVVTLGLRSSEVAARGAPWPKPVIAASVFDAHLQGFPEANGASGVANLTYIAPPPPGPVVRDLLKFREIASLARVAILVDEAAAESFAAYIDQLLQTAAELDIALDPVPVGATAASGLDRLRADADAVYVTPLARMTPGEFELLAQGLAIRRLPSFSYSADDVAKGIMASLGSIDLPLLARRIALNAYRILLGDDAGTLPVTLAPGEELVVNMRTVRELGVLPPLGTLLEARRLFEVPEDVTRSVTLKSAMQEAMVANLALAMEDQEVLAGAEEVRLARASLLPDLEASVNGETVSKGVAESSFGLRPQHNVDGGLTLRQVIYAQEAHANLSAQRSYQASREQNRTALQLDVALEAAEAYLNVLRGKTLEHVQQDNLDLTIASLRMARDRERIGAAGPGERLRLESELARRRADRIDAFARRAAAEISLNQVLNRPLDEPFITPEAELEGRTLLDGTLASGYLTDLNRFAILSDFLVEAALALAPEIQSLDAVVAAQERLLTSTRQAFYLPTVALQGNVSTNVLREGTGNALPAGLPVAEMPDFPWTVGLSISLPLFQGSSRVARRERTSAVLAQLQLQREFAGQAIEQGVRVELQFAQASLAIVNESETAARTARRSLELVTEAYGQGLARVVDLLEAQTSALLSERGVTNAIFDYLINLKRVERAVGKFEILATPEEQADFARRWEEYARKAVEGES
ncbi:TolC family protein [Candidatus Palauibacter sp.]|uniref:TolC family protein n=1 Tax=Candidatus Palauibacter sp. TaxID=3101350 RepID=UPI003B523CA8